MSSEIPPLYPKHQSPESESLSLAAFRLIANNPNIYSDGNPDTPYHIINPSDGTYTTLSFPNPDTQLRVGIGYRPLGNESLTPDTFSQRTLTAAVISHLSNDPEAIRRAAKEDMDGLLSQHSLLLCGIVSPEQIDFWIMSERLPYSISWSSYEPAVVKGSPVLSQAPKTPLPDEEFLDVHKMLEITPTHRDY